MTTTNQQNGFTLKAYTGDAKTLLAWNLSKPKAKNLAGFTIQYETNGKGPFYLPNNLRFKDPSKHVQDATQPATSSLNAPLHKFRWIHVPGSLHQGVDPFFGAYTYTVTPRYLDTKGSLQAIDRTLSVSVTLAVGPFGKGTLRLGFARGFTQSQAFVHHFGPAALKRPDGLLFDTSQVAGKNSKGESYTYADQYAWLGFTARERLFEIANEVLANKNLKLDVFAYDLNEPDLAKIFLQLAAQGRIRMILDNAPLHHNKQGTTKEDEFEQAFLQASKPKPAAILRGKFSRFAHDKEFIVSDGTGPILVLTGSTNLSVTGLYVNSNHVIVFDDRVIAKKYSDVFNTAWMQNVNGPAFAKSPEGAAPFSFTSNPKIKVSFSPHTAPVATGILQGIVDRIAQEETLKSGNVLFAVMSLDAKSTGPIFPALRDLHRDQRIFSYGITDTQDGISLYKPGQSEGILVTGKPLKSQLPPPFDQIPSLGGVGHQVHHKFVVCGFNSPNAVVYCGSSNLALLGEQQNGDNLISIQDQDVATVFAIEALGLVDHFHFLNQVAQNAKANGEVAPKTTASATAAKVKSASKQHQATAAGWFLGTTDAWTKPYFQPSDLKFIDRNLFA